MFEEYLIYSLVLAAFYLRLIYYAEEMLIRKIILKPLLVLGCFIATCYSRQPITELANMISNIVDSVNWKYFLHCIGIIVILLEIFLKKRQHSDWIARSLMGILNGIVISMLMVQTFPSKAFFNLNKFLGNEAYTYLAFYICLIFWSFIIGSAFYVVEKDLQKNI